MIGDTAHKTITTNCGLEQEYFFIDEKLYFKRPDIMNTGRTLLGSDASRGQDHSDRYFGWQANRIQNCIYEMEQEFWKVGIPNSTRHREVAPGQYEMAPMFQNANQSNDNNQLMMSIMKEVALKHGLRVLLHEKPFANVNGSGKHDNWSFGSNVEGTFFVPKSKYFLLATAAFVRGVHLYGDLLRSTVATSGNDHRLGGHEAPPGIISIYTGEAAYDMIQRSIRGEDASFRGSKNDQTFGVDYLPKFERQPNDRNRTSPIAFCGNRFEFRAVGSSVNTAWPTTVLNTITADSMNYIASEIEKAKAAGNENPLDSVISAVLKEHECVIFNGNGYSEEWLVEAEKRGLKNIPHTAAALKVLKEDSIRELFNRTSVLSAEELEIRRNVFYSNFALDIGVELKCLINMIDQLVLPAAFKHLKLISDAGVETGRAAIVANVNKLSEAVENLRALNEKLSGMECDVEKTEFLQAEVRPAMDAARTPADALELQVDQALWPLPSYHEMLNTLF